MSRSLIRPGMVYVGAGLVLIVVLWIAAWLVIDHEREELLAIGTERASRLAVFFEGNALGALRYGDGYARMVRREYRAGGVEAVRAAMDEVALDTTMVSHVTIIDERGTPVFNSAYPLRAGVNVLDRDYFAFQRERTDDRLFISLPNRGRNSGRLVIRLVRRIVLDDGSFGGVVFAALDAENVVAFFTAVSPGPGSSATLVGTDKRIRARSSWGRLGPGQDISGSDIWRELAERPVGGYLQTSVVDGVTRYYAYRLLPEYPLVVAIGVALADIGEDAAAYRRYVFLFAALASAVILMVMVVLLRERALARRLAEMGDALERRFVERTAELESVQGELLASERLAALGQLTGTVAHELRNPLSTIANSTAVVERRLADAGIDVGGSPDRIRRSVERCDAIVTELLDFARAQGPDPAPTTVDAWLPEVLVELTVPAGVDLRRELGAPGVVVSIDRERVRRAVVNLVQNARDAVADAGGCIRVATRPEDGGIAIEVHDDGPGIPQEVLARVREPLFSTKAFGFGLGVPIVERIAAEHGGTLEIDSTPGEGTRVTLHLPAAPPPSERTSPCAPAAS